MSKGLGPVQKKILEYLFKFKDLYESDKFGRKTILPEYDVVDIMEWFYDAEPKTLTLIQKQRIYKAIQRLEERGLISKRTTTEERDDLPPRNYLLVLVLIKGDKIYNSNKEEYENLKRLIGTQTI